MVNNSTNINKANNHLLLELLEHEGTTTYHVGTKAMASDSHTNIIFQYEAHIGQIVLVLM
jgi:hypothetical protein